jgi:hypothetical protein
LSLSDIISVLIIGVYMYDIRSVSKAVAGGIISMLVGEAARYGFHPQATTITAVGVVVTAVISYIVGHIVVYLAPKNKSQGEVKPPIQAVDVPPEIPNEHP